MFQFKHGHTFADSMHHITEGLFTSFDQPDSALSRWDSFHVSMRGDAQRCTHRFTARLQHLHCPHGLFHVINKLQEKCALNY